MLKQSVLTYLLLGVLLSLFGCGTSANSDSTKEEMESAGMDHGDGHMDDMDHSDMSMTSMEDSFMDAMGDGFQVVDAFGRAAPAAAETGAFYMTISNGTDADDVLESVLVEPCGMVELHEMKMDGDVMMMNEVDGGEIMIPAGKAVMLQPGGLHVMCMQKDGAFVAGSTIPITLVFQNAGPTQVEAEIRDR